MYIDAFTKWVERHEDVAVSIDKTDKTGEKEILKDKYTITMKGLLGARVDYIVDEKVLENLTEELGGLAGVLDVLYQDIQKADRLGKIFTEIIG